MLPPIPSSLQPVTAQQDPPRSRPEVAPVAPVEAVSADAAVTLQRRPAELQPEEEYRRRRRRAHASVEQSTEADEASADEPVEGVEDAPRKGLWIDIEV